jgi:hypothetical protein
MNERMTKTQKIGIWIYPDHQSNERKNIELCTAVRHTAYKLNWRIEKT